MAVRHVRTPAGVRKYGQPIGSIIVRDGDSPLDNLTLVPKKDQYYDDGTEVVSPKGEHFVISQDDDGSWWAAGLDGLYDDMAVEQAADEGEALELLNSVLAGKRKKNSPIFGSLSKHDNPAQYEANLKAQTERHKKLKATYGDRRKAGYDKIIAGHLDNAAAALKEGDDETAQEHLDRADAQVAAYAAQASHRARTREVGRKPTRVPFKNKPVNQRKWKRTGAGFYESSDGAKIQNDKGRDWNLFLPGEDKPHDTFASLNDAKAAMEQFNPAEHHAMKQFGSVHRKRALQFTKRINHVRDWVREQRKAHVQSQERDEAHEAIKQAQVELETLKRVIGDRDRYNAQVSKVEDSIRKMEAIYHRAKAKQVSGTPLSPRKRAEELLGKGKYDANGIALKPELVEKAKDSKSNHEHHSLDGNGKNVRVGKSDGKWWTNSTDGRAGSASGLRQSVRWHNSEGDALKYARSVTGQNAPVSSGPKKVRIGGQELGPGDRVTTEYGNGTITAIDRGIGVALDDGQNINVILGSHGHDRIKPYVKPPEFVDGDGSKVRVGDEVRLGTRSTGNYTVSRIDGDVIILRDENGRKRTMKRSDSHRITLFDQTEENRNAILLEDTAKYRPGMEKPAQTNTEQSIAGNQRTKPSASDPVNPTHPDDWAAYNAGYAASQRNSDNPDMEEAFARQRKIPDSGYDWFMDGWIDHAADKGKKTKGTDSAPEKPLTARWDFSTDDLPDLKKRRTQLLRQQKTKTQGGRLWKLVQQELDAVEAEIASRGKSFEDSIEMKETQVAVRSLLPQPESDFDGVAVMLLPQDEDQATISQWARVEQDKLHVTLAFLGDGKKANERGWTIDRIVDAMWWVAETTGVIEGTLGGVTRFTAPQDANDPVVLSVDAKGVNGLHDAVLTALRFAGMDEQTEHGYTPHLTIGYVPKGKPNPVKQWDSMPVIFDRIRIGHSGEEVDLSLAERNTKGEVSKLGSSLPDGLYEFIADFPNRHRRNLAEGKAVKLRCAKCKHEYFTDDYDNPKCPECSHVMHDDSEKKDVYNGMPGLRPVVQTDKPVQRAKRGKVRLRAVALVSNRPHVMPIRTRVKSLLETKDEEQCPYDASDSLMKNGVYVCEEGHQWSPSDPAAQAYHGDGPQRGIIQPLVKSEHLMMPVSRFNDEDILPGEWEKWGDVEAAYQKSEFQKGRMERALKFAKEGTMHPISLHQHAGGQVRVKDGHHRVIAAKRLGLKEIPYVIDGEKADWPTHAAMLGAEMLGIDLKVAKDGDGDGFIYDGTPQMRPAPIGTPVVGKITYHGDSGYPSAGLFGDSHNHTYVVGPDPEAQGSFFAVSEPQGDEDFWDDIVVQDAASKNEALKLLDAATRDNRKYGSKTVYGSNAKKPTNINIPKDTNDLSDEHAGRKTKPAGKPLKKSTTKRSTAKKTTSPRTRAKTVSKKVSTQKEITSLLNESGGDMTPEEKKSLNQLIGELITTAYKGPRAKIEEKPKRMPKGFWGRRAHYLFDKNGKPKRTDAEYDAAFLATSTAADPHAALARQHELHGRAKLAPARDNEHLWFPKDPENSPIAYSYVQAKPKLDKNGDPVFKMVNGKKTPVFDGYYTKPNGELDRKVVQRASGGESEAERIKDARIVALATHIDRLDRALQKESKTNEDAAATLLMRVLGIRAGSLSEEDQKKAASTRSVLKARSNAARGKEAHTYGATTLQARHVRFEDGGVVLEFNGKESVHNTHFTTDPLIVDVLKRYTKGKKPTDDLFPNASDESTNAYIKSKIGSDQVSNKDLRGYLATELAIKMMNQMPKPKTQEEFELAQAKIANRVSKTLNNRGAQALGSYIAKPIWNDWKKGVK